MNAPKPAILILDDDPSRLERFDSVLKFLSPAAEIFSWQSAKKMIQEVEDHWSRTVLISLDHDLYPPSGSSDDFGDGLECAKFLAPFQPQCPIIIHSSNADRAVMMQGEFELTGCNVRMVAPLGSDWIEAYWAKIVCQLLNL